MRFWTVLVQECKEGALLARQWHSLAHTQCLPVLCTAMAIADCWDCFQQHSTGVCGTRW